MFRITEHQAETIIGMLNDAIGEHSDWGTSPEKYPIIRHRGRPKHFKTFEPLFGNRVAFRLIDVDNLKRYLNDEPILDDDGEVHEQFGEQWEEEITCARTSDLFGDILAQLTTPEIKMIPEDIQTQLAYYRQHPRTS